MNKLKKHSVAKNCSDLLCEKNVSDREKLLKFKWRFLISDKLEQLEFKLEKMLGFRNMQEKLEKKCCLFCQVIFARALFKVNFCFVEMRKHSSTFYKLHFLKPCHLEKGWWQKTF